MKLEFYRAPIDGQACMRAPGRLGRTSLPRPASPPEDVASAACFLCHPEQDRWDQGSWPLPDGRLRVLENAYQFADRALIVTVPDPALHEATPAQLAEEDLAALLEAPWREDFQECFGLGGLEVVAFANVGRLAAQSRRHPHFQVVGFGGSRAAAGATDTAAVEDDLARAADQGRILTLAGLEGAEVVVPGRPGMTAEVWIPCPEDGSAQGRVLRWAGALRRTLSACESGISGDYNLVLLRRPRLVRLVPRGLSERAGLELSLPALVSIVIAADVTETVALWRAAFAASA